MAPSPSGKVRDCKSRDAGSIPAGAFTTLLDVEKLPGSLKAEWMALNHPIPVRVRARHLIWRRRILRRQISLALTAGRDPAIRWDSKSRQRGSTPRRPATFYFRGFLRGILFWRALMGFNSLFLNWPFALLASCLQLAKCAKGFAIPRRVRERLMAGEIAGGKDFVALRRFIGLTQIAFARALGISVHMLRNWEQGRRLEDPALVWLRVAARHPRVLKENLAATASSSEG